MACLTFCENREIVEGNPYLDEVILYDKHGSEKGIMGNLLFARRLAAKRFDIVIHLHATNRMHLVSWLAGIKIRIGYNRKCGWSLTHRLPDRKKEGLKHEAEYNFDLLSFIDIKFDRTLKAYFPIRDSAARSLRMLLKHYNISESLPRVIINPSASCPSKRWPAERFGHLINKMAEKYDTVFLAIGASSDRPFVARLREHADVPIYDFSGRLSLSMLAVLLKESALLISNDSGPVHIANAVGTPAVSIFGRNQPGLSPTRWRPLDPDSRVAWKDVGCTECLAHRCEINFLCLDAVSSRDVFQEVDRFSERLVKAVPVA